MEHLIYPCRNTLGCFCLFGAEAKGLWYLLASVLHPPGSCLLSGRFIFVHRCEFIDTCVSLRGGMLAFPSSVRTSRALDPPQLNCSFSGPLVVHIWVSTYLLTGFWPIGKSILIYALVFLEYCGAWLISQDIELNNTQVCSVPWGSPHFSSSNYNIDW